MNPEKDPPEAPGEGCSCRNNPQADCTVCDTSLSAYWCDVCQQEVSEKRCPFCGLKARKVRRKQAGTTS